MSDLIGRKLGKYKLEARLGEGGMAAVFQSRHPQFHRPVAIKVLPPTIGQDPSFRARFEREGRTTLRNLAVTLEEPDRTWTVVGDEGEFLSESKNVEIRRNVVVTSSDGLRLDTSVLRWDAARQRLWTDAPVTLSRGASVVRGSGLEVKIEDEATTVSGRVRATFDLSGGP